ncbi:MAG: hypothetical protein P4N41_04450 [Negativicutes bacterium]|nr:hypothetical protein [Negativicutes bacterium]
MAKEVWILIVAAVAFGTIAAYIYLNMGQALRSSWQRDRGYLVKSVRKRGLP